MLFFFLILVSQKKQSWGLGGVVSFLRPNRAIFHFPILVSAIFEDLFGGDPDYRIIVAQKKVKFFPQKIHAFLCLQNQKE